MNLPKNKISFSDEISRAAQLFEQGDLLSAGKFCQQILKESPKEDRAWALWGRILDQTGDNAGAVKCFLRAIECNPDEAAHHFNAGQQYLRLSNANKSIPPLEKALELKPDSSQILHTLGKAYAYINEYVKSCEFLLKALDLAPDNLELYEQLAYTLEKMNHLGEAMKILNKAISKWPKNVDFLLALAKLQIRNGQNEEAEANLDNFIDEYKKRKNLRTPEKLKLSVALNQKAKLLERKKLYNDAYEVFKDGQKWLAAVHQDTKAAIASSSERQNVGKEVNDFDELITQSRNWFSADKIKSWKTKNSGTIKPPFFLVGFPRSGTTLTGNILAAHRNMLTLQEEGIVESIINKMGRLVDSESEYPQILSDLTPDNIDILQTFYMNTALRQLGTENKEGKTIVDKMPLNNVNLGAIHRIFPDAKILSLLRDPRDACWSCFIQNFNYNPATVHFDTLANSVDLYVRVMDLYLLYRDILPEKIILEVKYEDLVNGQESITRAILEFAGQEWDPNVLEYYRQENNQYVATPSYEGVMKPIYKTAAGRWRNYKKFFEPHLEKLQPFVDKFGYDS